MIPLYIRRAIRHWQSWLAYRRSDRADPARAALIRQRRAASRRHGRTREIEAQLREATTSALRASVGAR